MRTCNSIIKQVLLGFILLQLSACNNFKKQKELQKTKGFDFVVLGSAKAGENFNKAMLIYLKQNEFPDSARSPIDGKYVSMRNPQNFTELKISNNTDSTVYVKSDDSVLVTNFYNQRWNIELKQWLQQDICRFQESYLLPINPHCSSMMFMHGNLSLSDSVILRVPFFFSNGNALMVSKKYHIKDTLITIENDTSYLIQSP